MCENKICYKCKSEKELIYFGKRKDSKDGHKNICKKCDNLIVAEWRKNNPDKVKKTKRLNYINNTEKIKLRYEKWLSNNPDYFENYRKNNQDKIKETQNKYRENNPGKIKESSDKWNKNNIEKIRKTQKNYRENNSEKVNNWKKNYREKNPEKVKETNKKSKEKQRKEKPHIKACSGMLHTVLRRFNKKKEGLSIDILGYSALDLKNHMISLFTEGMSWNNHGEWHIDHIKPVSSFDRETPMNIVNALSNLQPLWSTSRTINGIFYLGNINKGDNII